MGEPFLIGIAGGSASGKSTLVNTIAKTVADGRVAILRGPGGMLADNNVFSLALAMGMQVAIARLGSFVPLFFGAKIAKTFNVATPVLFGFLFLIIGLLTFIS